MVGLGGLREMAVGEGEPSWLSFDRANPLLRLRPLSVYRPVGCSFLGGTAVDITGKLMLRRGDNADADCARRVDEQLRMVTMPA